jgi:6,7-dimethyl-8-ribityllumazine synthase
MSAGAPQSPGDGRRLRIGVVTARFNDRITSRLRAGALSGLRDAGVPDAAIVSASAPGAVEIPFAARMLLADPTVDAVVALACVLRGETSHYEVVCRMIADGCRTAMEESGRPVAFGVLTCETEAQALSRSGPGADNKGYEAALAAVEMALVRREHGRG